MKVLRRYIRATVEVALWGFLALMCVSASVAQTGMSFEDTFTGTTLDATKWQQVRSASSTNVATLVNGMLHLPAYLRTDTCGKYAFSGDSGIVIESRFAGQGVSRDSYIELVTSDGISVIHVGDSNYWGSFYSNGGGAFAFSTATVGASTTAFKEYRISVNGSTLTMARGDTLSSLTETRTVALPVSVVGKSFYLRLGTGSPSFSPADFDYVRVYAASAAVTSKCDVPISITSQTISLSAASTATYGATPIALSASATSGLPVSFSLVSGPATLNTSTNTLTITGAGSIVVKASQAGNTSYSAAPDVQQTITIAPKALTVTASSASRAFAAANPGSPGFTAPALVGADTISSVTYTYAATASASAVIGSTHAITPSAAVFGSGSATNYTISYAAGTLTVAGAASQTMTFSATPTATYGATPIALSASATSGLPVSFSLVSGPATLNTSTNTLSLTGAGSVVVKATQAGSSNYGAAPDVQQTISVAPKALTVTASNASRAFAAANPGSPGFTAPALVGADTISSVTYAYAATASASAVIGSTHAITPSAAVFGSGSAANYTISYATGTLTVAGAASQTITFSATPTANYGATPIALSASATSGLPVSFSLISGPATLNTSTNTLSFTGAGSIVVKAGQAGNTNYGAAPDVQQTITVAPKALTITANNASRAFAASNPTNPGFTASALVGTDAIANVSYAYAPTATASAVIGSTHAITPSAAVFGSGSATNYTISYAAGTLTVAGAASQTITFSATPTANYGATPIALSASATSGLPMSFSLVSGPAMLNTSTNTLTITGAGSIVVKASQAGNTSYSAAPDVQQTITVAPKALTVTASSASRAFAAANPGSPGFTAPALVGADTISSVTYTYAATASASAVIGSTHAITPSAAVFGSGSAANYTVSYATGTLTVAGLASQSIIFSAASTATYGATPIALSASATSGLPVSFTLVSGPATLNTSTNTLTITGAGSVVVKASQAGNTSYSAATDVQQTITVAPKALTVTASSASRAFAAANPTTPGFTAPALVGTDSISGVTYTYAATATAAAAVGSTHAITPSAAVFGSGSAANYTITYAAGTLTVAGLASQSISFSAAPSLVVGVAGTVSATGGASGNAVTFGTSTPANCSVTGNVVTGLAAGICSVVANQAGNASYSAAAPVTQSISVSAPAPAPAMSFEDTFSGTALDASKWQQVRFGSSTDQVTLVTGMLHLPAYLRTDTCGKYAFSGDSGIVIESRFAGQASSRDSYIELVGSDGVSVIHVGDSNYWGSFYSNGGGAFAFSTATVGASTTAFKEYRITISGSTLTIARGDSLSSLTESRTIALPISVVGKIFYLRLGTGSPSFSPADFDYVRVYAASAAVTSNCDAPISQLVALNVSLSGNGTGVVTSNPPGLVCGAACNATYGSGAIVILTAKPDIGSRFTGWSGACSGTSGSCTVSMTATKGVTASFALGASVPDAPTGVSANPGSGQAIVSFTAPANNGGAAISGYTVTSTQGNLTASGASSPITVPGLTNGTSYAFVVTTNSAVGASAPSTSSNSVTPLSSYASSLKCADPLQSADVVYCDDFTGTTLNPNLWSVVGDGVEVGGGIADVKMNVLDKRTTLTSRFTPLKKIRLEVRHKIHLMSASQGSVEFESISPAYGNFALNFANFQIPLSWGMRCFANNTVSMGGEFASCAPMNNAPTVDYFDKWMVTVVEYDTSTGLVTLDLGGDGSIELQATLPVQHRIPIGKLKFGGFGYPGISHQLDYVRVSGIQADATPPGIPSGVVASPVNANQVSLSWAASTDDVAVAGYRIFTDGVLVASVGNQTTYGPLSVTPYGYAVAACDVAGNCSPQSASTLPSPSSSVSIAPPKQGAVAAGIGHALALGQDGTLMAWGNNEFGQLGDGSTTSRSTPKTIGSGFSMVAAGGYHTVAIKTDGSLWAWGSNGDGQLGDGTTSSRTSPVRIGSDFKYVSAGTYHTVAIKTDGTLWVWGANSYGQLGDGTTVQRTSRVKIGTGFETVSAGDFHTLGIKSDHSLWSWGLNDDRQLGDLTVVDRSSPVPVMAGTGFVSVSGGARFTMAIQMDGTLWGWGTDYYAQLGDGSGGQGKNDPRRVGQGYSTVSAGSGHGLAITPSGALWAWGMGLWGAVGDGQQNYWTRQTNIGTGFTAVAAGTQYSVAIKSDGTVWSWGRNDTGQLGDTTYATRLTQVLVSNTAANGPLDLLPEVANNIPADKMPPFWAQVTKSTNVSTAITYNAEDLNKNGSVYVVAYLDPKSPLLTGIAPAVKSSTSTTKGGDTPVAAVLTRSGWKQTSSTTPTEPLYSGTLSASTNTFSMYDASLFDQAKDNGLFCVSYAGSSTASAKGLSARSVVSGADASLDQCPPITFGSSAPTQASQTISFLAPTAATYGDAPITLSATSSSSQFVYLTLVSGPATLNGNVLSIKGAGNIVVKATADASANYLAALPVEQTITVAPKALTITANNVSKAFGAANPTTPGFTAPALVGTDTISSVGYTYAATASASANVGTSHSITPSAAVFSSGSAANYTISYATGTLTVAGLASQTISFSAASTATYGATPIALSASATSGLPVSFSLVSGPATLNTSTNTLTLTGAGSVVVKATQAGNSNYSAAPDVQQTISVAPKALTVTASNAIRAFAAANPGSPGFTAPALVGADTISSVTYTYASTASASAVIGSTHAITPSAAVFGSGSAANYTISYATGTLTVAGAASQSISFSAAPTANYGATPIALSASASSGLPVSFTVVSGPATLNTSTNTLTITGAGSVVVKASQAGNTSYSAAPDVQQTITVAPKALTITANNVSKAFGAANPTTPGFTAPALVGTDTISSVGYTYAATASASANVGTSHSITPSAAVFSSGSAANYTITYATGTLTVAGAASQSISFSAASTATYGATPITLSASATSGLPVSFSLISGPATLNTSTNTLTLTGAGSIVLKASQAGSVNYGAAPDVQQTITVAPKALTITANNASRAFGAANPSSPGFTASALVGTDAISNVTYTYAATATAAAIVGSTHAITPSAAVFGSGSAANYNITYVAGVLSITVATDVPTPSTPLNLKTAVMGPGQIDLSWSASSGTVGVASYRVYRDGTLLATVGNITSYTDTSPQASTAYSYSVMACDIALNCSGQSTNAQTSTPAQPSVVLSPGWNLVGNGGSTAMNVASLFGDASKVYSLWKWVRSGNTPGISYPTWAMYAPGQADGGAAYASSKGYEVLTSIQSAEGFWVNAKAAMSVPMTAPAWILSSTFQPGQSNALPSGWSLIATGEANTASAFNKAIGETLPTPTSIPNNLTTLWAWENSTSRWYFYAPSLEAQGTLQGYVSDKGYLDFGSRTLTPTAGVWVNR